MTRERFIDGRMEQLDLAHVAKILEEKANRWVPLAETEIVTSTFWRELAKHTVRGALSDWYDRMSSSEFSGCHSAAQVAEKLYTELRQKQNFDICWGAIGEGAQDYWISLVERLQLAQKADLSSQEEGDVVCSVCEKRTATICYDCQLDNIRRACRALTQEAASCEADEEQQIQAERAQKHGDIFYGHTSLGMVWSGLLMNWLQCGTIPPIPADIVSLMLAANKVNRACFPGGRGRPDSYADARIYIKLALECYAREEDR